MHNDSIVLIKESLLDKQEMVDDVLIIYVSGMIGIGKSTCITKALDRLSNKALNIHQLEAKSLEELDNHHLLSSINNIIEKEENTTIIVETPIPLSQTDLLEKLGARINIREITIQYPDYSQFERWITENRILGDLKQIYHQTRGHPIFVKAYLSEPNNVENQIRQVVNMQLKLVDQKDLMILREIVNGRIAFGSAGDSLQRLHQMGLIVREQSTWKIPFSIIKNSISPVIHSPEIYRPILNYNNIDEKHIKVLQSMLKDESAVRCIKIGTGKSTAEVYQIIRYDPGDRVLPSLFIKIDINDKIEREISTGYETLKRWIPNWIPEIIGKYCEGALCGFMMQGAGRTSESANASPLSEIEKREITCMAIQPILETSLPLLHQTHSKSSPASCLGMSGKHRLTAISNIQKMMISHRNIEYFFTNIDKITTPLLKGLCHGDLHPGNIIIDDLKSPWFIDFASVREDRAFFFDYVTLEINLTYLDNNCAPEMIDCAYNLIDKGVERHNIEIILPTIDDNKIFSIIFLIRECAKKNFIKAELDTSYNFKMNYEFAYLCYGLLLLSQLDESTIERKSTQLKNLIRRLDAVAEKFMSESYE